VATPWSPKPAALASAAINKNGTPVVITLSCAFKFEIEVKKQSSSMDILFMVFKNYIRQI